MRTDSKGNPLKYGDMISVEMLYRISFKRGIESEYLDVLAQIDDDTNDWPTPSTLKLNRNGLPCHWHIVGKPVCVKYNPLKEHANG